MGSGTKRNIIIAASTAILGVVGFVFYVKLDADAKAARYQAGRAQDSSVEKGVNSLKLSDYIGVYKDGREDVKAMRGVCTAANQLAKKIDAKSLEPAFGAALSPEYQAARDQADTDAAGLDQLKSSLLLYEKRCDYYTVSSEVEVKVRDIKDADEYEQQITRNGSCGFATCIREGRHQPYADHWEKIHQLYTDRATYYRQSACPLVKRYHTFCEQLEKSVATAADYSKKYVAAVRAEDNQQINALAGDDSVTRAFGELGKIAKQLDPTAADANEFYASVMKHHEQALRETVRAINE